ncbi:ABC transporter ATP-binding protein [Actinomadura macrotermitis]|uniref:Lipopolysaccharide export system ATP-binding protein LptB n=1 Tax=Actinomadura macrotermitis TaxID=2585200 RepID=A0A7K0BLM7_9ACTN|nr:ABC transporter ATP-binding protein [Actinomadura macrotermitis]MQY02089.1 Lipopolysaccharide export system ATP-binding protein LptB [Actinomadura macrotermitis]
MTETLPNPLSKSKTLHVSDLTVRYGGVAALKGVGLTVGPGELVGLIGPNGAGKTTFIDAVCGFTKADGQVRLGDRDLTGSRAYVRARAGLGRTWQSADLYDDLTVRENLTVGAYRPDWRRTVREALRGRARHDDGVAHLLGIQDLLDRPSDGLSAGQRKLVDLARALAGRPDVLLLDEPAAGLDTDESGLLATRLRSVARSGTGVLLVDHDMSLVLGVCDRIVVLDFGSVIATGTPREIQTNDDVIAAYLGRAARSDVDPEEITHD